MNAIQRLRQNARGRSFSDPARTDKKISVREPVLLDRILQRARDMRLPDEIVERLRPIFARENLITHAPNLMRRGRARKQKTRDRFGSPLRRALGTMNLRDGP